MTQTEQTVQTVQTMDPTKVTIRISALLPVESWKERIDQLNVWFAIDDDGDIRDDMDNIMTIKKFLDVDMYHTIEDNENDELYKGMTILCHLIWLYRDMQLSKKDIREVLHNAEKGLRKKVYKELKSIRKEIYRAFNTIIKNGFDINKQSNNGRQLILPVAEILDIDNIKERSRAKFFKCLVKHGADLHKTNIWVAGRYYKNFRMLAEECRSMSDMDSVISSALEKLNKS